MPMDVHLLRETKPILEKIYHQIIPVDQKCEISLPDELPDITEVVFSEAKVFLRGKEVDKDKIIIKGIVVVNILYYSDSSSNIQKFDAQIPFSIDTRCEGADDTCKLVTSLTVQQCGAKILSVRRLLVKADLCALVQCFREAVLTVSCLPDDDCNSVQQLHYKTRTVCPITYSEKSFVVTDTFKLPGQCESISALLLEKTNITLDDLKIVGSKIIIKGSAFCDVLYRTEDSEHPCTVDFSTEFSQILEMDRHIANAIPETVLALTGAYFHTEATLSSEERQIYLELHIAAQCILSDEFEVDYITDAYLPLNELSLSKETIKMPVCDTEYSVSREAMGLIECGDDLGKSIFAVIGKGIPRITEAEGQIVLQVDFFVSSLHCDEHGKLASVMGKVSCKEDIEEALRDSTFSSDLSADLYITSKGKGIEVRVPCKISLIDKNDAVIEIVNEIAETGSKVDLSTEPSLILYRYCAGESIWSIAKQHCSTMELIRCANKQNESGEYFDKQVIIIPKYRA